MSQLELEATLRQHDVDASTLSLVFESGDERVYQLLAPAGAAVEQWQRLRDLKDVTGYWPVIGWGARWLDGNDWYLAQLLDGSTAEILAESKHVDLGQWREARVREYVEVLAKDEETDAEADDPFYDVRGEWPDGVAPTSDFHSPTADADRSGPQPLTPIALVPATEGWQVPAVLRFDRGDECPPSIHVAMLKHWTETYGAELVCMLPDLMEMRVTRPPTTRGAALALAEEQFIYCQDIVIQGTQTIEALAAEVLCAPVWFFWWD